MSSARTRELGVIVSEPVQGGWRARGIVPFGA